MGLGNCQCDELTFDDERMFYYLKENKPYSGLCITYNNNGTLNLTKEFTDGKLEGKMIRYRQNGKKLSIVEFHNNQINGKALILDINEKDSIIQHYKSGVLIRN